MTQTAFRPPRLGPGAVYLERFDDAFRSHGDLVRVVEIEPAAHWIRPTDHPRPRGSDFTLSALKSLPQAAILHGVGYPLGGTVCDQTWHTPEFRRWAEALRAPWASEHLSILDVPAKGGPACCGFLMPPAQSPAAVRLAAGNIAARREAVGRPFAFETGVNYFARRRGEMPDGEFFAAVADEADCGILLDLANLTVNARNGRGAVEDVLAALPLDRVWEVHLARPEFAHGAWLDAHAGALEPELVDLAADVLPDLPNVGAVIFEVAPDRGEALGEAGFLRQMEHLQALWARAGSGRPATYARRPLLRAGGPDPRAWEAEIAAHMLPGDPRRGDPAFDLYGVLVRAFRKGAVSDLLEMSVRQILRTLGPSAFSELFDSYAAAVAPSLYPSDEALAFAGFISDRAGYITGLADILAFEAAVVRAAANGRPERVALSHDIESLIVAAAEGRSFQGLAREPNVLEIGGPGAFIRRLQPEATA